MRSSRLPLGDGRMRERRRRLPHRRDEPPGETGTLARHDARAERDADGIDVTARVLEGTGVTTAEET
ncbi:hypothetical protein HUG10_09020 [Halorarum halophilum]|uniref:Uncharacterized protein n=1 Tax=Halorarum halophilum TaxID=2743090 RepID=A0A7D5L2R8_9EURY|nr:hypothetical protein [Halobaculum halophilum]QLG27683.1 hypothetical protein HUG10_09020 [Halobaculum halophilum]